MLTVGCGFIQEYAKCTLEWLQMIIYIDDHERCENILFIMFWVHASQPQFQSN